MLIGLSIKRMKLFVQNIKRKFTEGKLLKKKKIGRWDI